MSPQQKSVCNNLSLPSPDNDSNVELMVDRTAWEKKPHGNQFGGINNRLNTGRESIPIQEVKAILENGGSITPAAFRDNTRRNDTWEQQQLFGLDFDDGITVDAFQDRCKELNIEPNLVHLTFSHTDAHHKFRVYFLHDYAIQDIRVRNLVQSTLRELFTRRSQSGIEYEPDPQCDDPARIFLGTNQDFIHEDYDARINVITLLDTLLDYKEKTDKSNFARFLKRFAIAANLKLRHQDSGIGLEINQISQKIGDELTVNPIYTIQITTDSSPNVHSVSQGTHSHVFSNNLFYQVAWRSVPDDVTPPKSKQRASVDYQDGAEVKEHEKPRLTDDDKLVLQEKCPLIKDLFAGNRQLHHNERRILVTNLRHRNGGIKWYYEGLNSRTDYEVPESILRQATRYNYLPERCDNCTYRRRCDHKTNLLQQIPVRQREIRIIDTAPVREPLHKTVFKLQDALLSAIRADDNKIYVIKADTGIGKTELLLRSLPREFAVAFPTHRLKQEAADRYQAMSTQALYLWPERPRLPEQYEKVLQHYHDIRRQGTIKLLKKAMGDEAVLKDREWQEYIGYYLHAIKTVNVEPRLVLTHEKAFQLKHPRLFIFDEDFLNTFIRITTHSLDDIKLILELAKEQKGRKYRQIEHHLEAIFNAPSDEVKPLPAWNYPQETLHSLLIKMPPVFCSPVEALFTGKAYIKASNDRAARENIHCIEMQTLRNDAKYIVLSATANETFYRQLFGDRLEFIDLTGTEMKGRCIVHNDRSYSKTGIAKDMKKFTKQVIADRSRYGFENVITHQVFAGALQKAGIDVAGHFGALEGLDGLGGKDIAIYGTPRMPQFCYKLYAYLLNIDIDKDPLDYNWHTIKRGEFEYRIYICSGNPDMHELQLGLIEADLIQAVGRARLVRNDCTVHVFAAMPLPGCILTR